MNLTKKLKSGILGLDLLSLTVCDTSGEIVSKNTFLYEEYLR